MIAVFALPRSLRLQKDSGNDCSRLINPEEEEYVNQALDNLYSSLPTRHRTIVEEHLFGGGANGIAWVDALDAVLLEASGPETAAVFFKGALKSNPTQLEDAEYLLQLYLDYATCGDDQAPLPFTKEILQGQFILLIYDRTNGRTIAARSGTEQPLYWGTATPAKDGLFFSTDISLIESECVDAVEFPKGKIFVSDDRSTAGRLSAYTGESSNRRKKRKGGNPGQSSQEDRSDLVYSESANNLCGLMLLASSPPAPTAMEYEPSFEQGINNNNIN